MSWDKEHIRRLLHEVANTKGYDSMKKSEELLDYVTKHASKQPPSPGDTGEAGSSGRVKE